MSTTQAKPEIVSQPSFLQEGIGLRIARSIGTWLFGLGYALWLGGLIALGALMAPNVAATLHDPVVTAGGEPLRRAILNGIVGNSFRVLNPLSIYCYFAMAVGSYLEIRKRSTEYRAWTFFRIMFGFFAALDVGRLDSLLGRMDRAQAVSNMALFNSLHHQYETIAMIQFPLLLVVGALTAGRDWFARNDRN